MYFRKDEEDFFITNYLDQSSGSDISAEELIHSHIKGVEMLIVSLRGVNF